MTPKSSGVDDEGDDPLETLRLSQDTESPVRGEGQRGEGERREQGERDKRPVPPHGQRVAGLPDGPQQQRKQHTEGTQDQPRELDRIVEPGERKPQTSEVGGDERCQEDQTREHVQRAS